MSAVVATKPGRSIRGFTPSRRVVIELLFVAIALGLLVLAPAFLSDFRLNQMGKFLTFAIVAIGIDLLWGYTGMLSLGQAVFFGLGGYAMAMYLKLEASGDALPDFMGWSGLETLPWFWEPFRSPWFAFPAAIIGPGILAFLLGYMLFRSRVTGVYFSIVTQAAADDPQHVPHRSAGVQRGNERDHELHAAVRRPSAIRLRSRRSTS